LGDGTQRAFSAKSPPRLSVVFVRLLREGQEGRRAGPSGSPTADGPRGLAEPCGPRPAAGLDRGLGGLGPTHPRAARGPGRPSSVVEPDRPRRSPVQAAGGPGRGLASPPSNGGELHHPGRPRHGGPGPRAPVRTVAARGQWRPCRWPLRRSASASPHPTARRPARAGIVPAIGAATPAPGNGFNGPKRPIRGSSPESAKTCPSQFKGSLSAISSGMPAASSDSEDADPLDSDQRVWPAAGQELFALEDRLALRADLGQSRSGNSSLSPQACRGVPRPPNWPYRRLDRSPLPVPLETTLGAPGRARRF